ncbi:hypothetical protein P7K49_039762 [Saguinus oedipus]|uniref:Uncharacterized protein n=1 Tax=Saguinus oedipus TaxID=9490 RepID=A0ABQ9TAB8_SAGOE|nr:hypothetical protein P7K49_039762 [Saguinus oedipus]
MRFHTSPSTHQFNSLNKGTAEHIEGYFASVFKAEQSFSISQSFTAISLYSGILMKRPLNKGTAEQSFTGISLYSGILLERPLNKCKAEEIEGYVASLNKGTAEQTEGYASSVFKAEFYCYCMNKCKAEQNEGSVASAEFYCYFLNKCKAEHIKGYIASLNKGTAEQSFTAISLYAGILLDRPLNKDTAEQSLTLNKRTADQIEEYVASVQSFTAISQSFTQNKCKAEQSFTAISLYSGILMKRPLNKGTAEQIEGYLSSVF